MAKFHAKLTASEYANLRNVSMRGGFTYDFSRDDQYNVEFNVKHREKTRFFEELENVVSSGETSWSEIFAMNSKAKIKSK